MLRPYAVHEDVAEFHRTLLQGTGFSPNSTITDISVNKLINLTSSSVEIQFRGAGYLIPFQALGEWPLFQTDYLRLVVCLGVSSLISTSLKPSPTMGVGNLQSSTSVFRDLFNEEMKRIFNPQTKTSDIRFVAKYLKGTPAEKALLEPSNPAFNIQTNEERLLQFNEWTRLESEIKGLVDYV